MMVRKRISILRITFLNDSPPVITAFGPAISTPATSRNHFTESSETSHLFFFSARVKVTQPGIIVPKWHHTRIKFFRSKTPKSLNSRIARQVKVTPIGILSPKVVSHPQEISFKNTQESQHSQRFVVRQGESNTNWHYLSEVASHPQEVSFKDSQESEQSQRLVVRQENDRKGKTKEKQGETRRNKEKQKETKENKGLKGVPPRLDPRN